MAVNTLARGRETGSPAHALRALIIAVATAAGMMVTVYRLVVRPWHIRWGATPEEVAAPMPGDDSVESPNFNTTHAITIDAPPKAVWPWLAQMGQGRGGLYTYDWLENAMGLDIHSLDRIVPEFQDLKVGDIISLDKSGFGPEVASLEPEQHMLLTGRNDSMDTSWAWTLRETEEGRTRLVTRWRADYGFTNILTRDTLRRFSKEPRRTLAVVLMSAFMEPGQFVMERGMLRGIKKRAESAARG
jgi:hypothetical protein